MELKWFNTGCDDRSANITKGININLIKMIGKESVYGFKINDGRYINGGLCGLDNAKKYVRDYVSQNFK